MCNHMISRTRQTCNQARIFNCKSRRFFKMKRCGGTSAVQKATEEIQSICEKIKSDLESQANRSFSTDGFKAVSYKSQVVAGTNYFVKIDVGDGEFIHVRIFQALPCNGGNLSLHSFQDGKSLEEDIAYF